MTSPAPGTHFFSGELLGHRVLLRLLRVNDRGEVWYGFNRRTEEVAVFKLIRTEKHRVPRLTALADFLQKTSCRQLIRVRDFTLLDGFFLAEMEYAAGGSLRTALKHARRFSPGQAVFVMREVLTALEELHRNGIVHRDIKPGNILLTAEGEIRLGDFGIARVTGFPEKSPAVFGTPGSISPEQAVDSTGIDGRSDLFSLASMIYALLTGHPRFPGNSLAETGKLILAGKPAQMAEELRPFAPGDMIGLLCRMSEPSPDDRPADAGEVLRALDRMNLFGERLSAGETPV